MRPDRGFMGSDGDNEMTEADLICAAKHGDERAFSEIFETYKIPIYYFILRRIRNETDTEDLLMETFERAFAGIKHFIPLVKLRTWLTEIAKNRITDYFRVKKNLPVIVDYDLTYEDNHTPEKFCICHKEFKIIQDGIKTLRNPFHRAVMELYIEGWKMREIASELGIPLGTVQGNIHRSKRKLKKLVA